MGSSKSSRSKSSRGKSKKAKATARPSKAKPRAQAGASAASRAAPASDPKLRARPARRPDAGGKAKPAGRPARGPAQGSERTSVGAWWVPALVLLGTLIVTFHKAILGGMAYAPADVIGGARIIGQFVKGEALAGRSLPLWCPYIFAGMPTVGSLMYAPFYPLDIALKSIFDWAPWLRIPYSPNYLHYLLGGLWTYLLLRHVKVGRAGSVLGAVAFAFSPYLVVLTPAGHGGKLWTASYLPLLVLTAMRLFERPGLLRFAVAALAMGAAFLANHPQIAYYEVIALGLYWLVTSLPRLRGAPRDALSRGGLLIAVVVAGALMAAVVYLPVREYARFSIRGEGAGSYDWATSWSFHPAEIVTFAIPSFFGFGGQTYWGHMPFTEAPNYLGVTVLLLATAALRRPLGRFRLFLLATFVISLVVSFGKFVPVLYSPMYHLLPYFKRFRVPVLIHILCLFSTAVLAGLGLREATQREDGRKPMVPWLIAMGAAALFLLVLPEPFKSLSSGTESGTLAGQRHTMALGDAAKAFLLSLAVYGSLGLKRRVLAHILPVALVILDLTWVNLKIAEPHYQSFDEGAYFAETPVVKYLKEQPGHFRILPVGGELSGNRPMYYHLSSLSGYSPARLRVSSELLEPSMMAGPAVLNMLNCKYVTSPRPLRHPPSWEEVLRQESAVAYRNNDALPRAWLVGQIEVMETREDMFRRLRDPGFDPSTTALLYEHVDLDVAMIVDGSVEVAAYTPNLIEFETRSQAPTFMVASEVYYPAGWRAHVDGEETPIYQVNHGLRGVALPPGEHRVTMEFRPQSYVVGRAVSLGAGGALLACLALGWVVRIRKTRAA